MALSIGEFLRAELDLRNLSEREFARRSGLGLSHVYQILRGERRHTRADTMEKIATGLRLSPAEVYVRMGKTSPSPGEEKTDPFEVEVLALFRDIPRENRTVVLQVLRGMGMSVSQPFRANRRTRRGVNQPVESGSVAAMQEKTGSNEVLTAHYDRVDHAA